MQFTILAQELTKPLKIMKNFVSKEIPYLNDFYFTLDDINKKLTISCSDSYNTLTKTFDCQSITKDAFFKISSNLLHIIDSFPKDSEITFRLDKNLEFIFLSTGNKKIKLPLSKSQGSIIVPKSDAFPKTYFHMYWSNLLSYCKYVESCIDSDSNNFNFINFKSIQTAAPQFQNTKSIQLTATNRKQIANVIINEEYTSAYDDFNFSINPNDLYRFFSSIDNVFNSLTFSNDNGRILIKYDDIHFYINTYATSIPDINLFNPVSNNTITLNYKELLDSLLPSLSMSDRITIQSNSKKVSLSYSQSSTIPYSFYDVEYTDIIYSNTSSKSVYITLDSHQLYTILNSMHQQGIITTDKVDLSTQELTFIIESNEKPIKIISAHYSAILPPVKIKLPDVVNA